MGKIMDFFRKNPEACDTNELPRFWAKWNMQHVPNYEIYELKDVNYAADRAVLMNRRTRVLVYPMLSLLLNRDYNWKPFVFNGGKN